MKKKKLVSSIFIFVGSVLTFFIFSSACSQFSFNVDARNAEKKPSNQELDIRSLEVFAYWWREADALKGIDTDNPPPKDNYRQIDVWQYDGEGITTSPHEVDVLIDLASVRRFNGKLELSLTLGFSETPNYSQNEQKGLKTIWSSEKILAQQDVSVLENRQQAVRFQKVDLRDALNAELEGRHVTEFKFTVVVYDEHGEKIGIREKSLKVILGD